MASVFETLYAVDCREHTESKNGLTYLSWAWAWAELKKRYPDVTYTIYEREDGRIYWDDGHTAWVKTGVTVNGLEHIEYLPVMNNRNQSIPVEVITSMDANKAIQRSLTKAAARHGLGLYIYAGEDLPDVISGDRTVWDELIDKMQKSMVDEKSLMQIIHGRGKAMTAEHIDDLAPEFVSGYVLKYWDRILEQRILNLKEIGGKE